MKNTILLLSIVICTTFSISAQETITSQEFKIEFTVPNDFKKYDTGSDNVLGYEDKNENLAIDIEKIQLSKWKTEYINSQKIAAPQIAKYLSLKEVNPKGYILPNIKSSYAVIAYEIEEEKTPVIVAAILNKKSGLAYEITIYCYNNTIDLGHKIIKSFKLK